VTPVALRTRDHQAWDLHPAQLPTRCAAVFSFFLSARAAATTRLRAFVEKAAGLSLEELPGRLFRAIGMPQSARERGS
jgi:hypothetical protein